MRIETCSDDGIFALVPLTSGMDIRELEIDLSSHWVANAVARKSASEHARREEKSGYMRHAIHILRF